MFAFHLWMQDANNLFIKGNLSVLCVYVTKNKKTEESPEAKKISMTVSGLLGRAW